MRKKPGPKNKPQQHSAVVVASVTVGAPAPTTIDEVKQRYDAAMVEIDQARKALDDRDAALGRERDALATERARVKALESHTRQLQAAQVQELDELERARTAAIAGFVEEHRRALAGLQDSRDRLVADVAERSRVMDALGVDARRALDAELDAERARRLEALAGDISARRSAEDAALEQRRAEAASDRARLRAEVEAELERRRTDLDVALRALDHRRGQLDERAREQAAEARRLDNDRAAIDQDRSALQARLPEIEARLQEEADHEAQRLRDRVRELVRRNQALEGELERRRDADVQAGHRTKEELCESERRLRAEVETLKAELAKRPPAELLERYDEARRELAAREQELVAVRRELSEVKNRASSYQHSVAEVEHQLELYESAQRRALSLALENEQLGKNVDRLRALYAPPREHAAAGQIERPRFTAQEISAPAEAADEMAWLDGIQTASAASGLHFPRRLIEAFHTALKTADWSPVVVLAGVSGTGKSELARVYARFGGLLFDSLAVEPNWDSPQSLVGFFNAIDGQFNATPILQLLAQSCREPKDNDGTNDLVHLVLLDEMNLSHVELYLSEVISKLEQRRGTDAVPHLELDLGAGVAKYRVGLGRNVVWVGTMNEDETTKSLSDKMIDRSTLIAFPRPKTLRRRSRAELMEPRAMLPRADWVRWQVHESPFTDDEIAAYKRPLEEINEHLAQVGRALGHRVWQSVESYLANHPRVRAARAEGDQERRSRALSGALDRAFEDAMAQKVMPKLRGIETAGQAKSRCLDPIRKIVANMSLAADFDQACRSEQGAFIWRSAAYLEIEP